MNQLQREILQCRKCPRLVEYREKVALEKRRAYLHWEYWGKPVPSFGDPAARLLILGLAPGAHGANRTGRMFTGDGSGDFLFRTLYRVGFCNQEAGDSREDGLELIDAYITAALHCVPPQNKPDAAEKTACRSFLVRELELLSKVRVVVALGKIAWDAFLVSREAAGYPPLRPRPQFSHATTVRFEKGPILIGSYHPSRQNTQTGRLTEEMFESVFLKARDLVDSPTGS